jgi:hypothetical protein
MKTAHVKSLILTTGMVAMVVVGGIAPALGGTNSAGPNLSAEKAAISKDLNHISVTRSRVETLKAQLQEEKRSGMNTNATKKELVKAKADHQHAKAYLRADKKDLILDHQTYIRERRAAVTKDQWEVVKTRFSAEGDLTAGRSTAVDKARNIVDKKHQLKEDKLALKQAKINRNNDVLAANEKIQKADGQNVAILKIENTGAKFQNLVMK